MRQQKKILLSQSLLEVKELMDGYYTACVNIDKFVKNVRGNWRNSVYISCRTCKYDKQKCCEDILLSFDQDGVAAFIAVTDVNSIYSTIIDKTECLSEWSNRKFLCVFENVIKTQTCPELGCPILQLLKKI